MKSDYLKVFHGFIYFHILFIPVEQFLYLSFILWLRRSSKNLSMIACQSYLFEGWILPAVVTRASLISRHKNKNWKSSAIYISDFTWSYTTSKLWSVFNGWVSHPVTGGMRLQIVLRNQKGRVTSKSFDLPYTPGEESRQSRCGFAALSSFFIA